MSLAACVLLVAVYILLNSQTLEDVTGYRLLAIIASSMPISGYLGIFSVMMLENTSLPLPGSLFLPLAGYYVFVGKISFLGVLTASCLGSVIGSLIIFSMGLKFGAPRIYWVASKLGVSQESLARN